MSQSVMNKNHILIVGSGSVGKRHAKNFDQQGCRISSVDPRPDRQEEINSAIGNLVAVYPSLTQALDSDKYDGVVICSPTSFHPEQTKMALQKLLPVLMEKPVAMTLKEALDLAEVAKGVSIQILLGYTWRWWEPLIRVRNILQKNTMGCVRYVQFYMSAHLADWHPWEPYQDFFMSKKNLGGGALLDESHWIDLMVWFFGLPQSIFGRVEKISDLDIETDDNVDFLSLYQDGKRIYGHLDLFGRPHERFIRFVCDDGTIFWSSEPNEIRISSGKDNTLSVEKFTCVRNDMFLAVAKEFLNVVAGETKMSCSLDDGIKTMKVIEAIRESYRTGMTVHI